MHDQPADVAPTDARNVLPTYSLCLSKLADDTAFARSLAQHFPDVDPQTFLIGRGLSVTHTLMMALAEEYLRPHGLSWSKLFVLLRLRAAQEAGDDGLAPSTLSKHLGLTRNTMSALLSGLERQGYIQRDAHPDDRRRFVMHLTDDGQAIIQAYAVPLFAQLQALVQQIDASQRAALLDALAQLQAVFTRQIETYDHINTTN